MKTLKRIWEALKKYKYYTITLIVLLVLGITAGKLFNIDVGILPLIIFSLLGGSVLLAVFAGIRNTWVFDGKKVEAIVVGIIAIAFVVFSTWLIITKT